jgi:hypothetical protein
MKYPYVPVDNRGVLMPFLPFKFVMDHESFNATALVDSGASMNVLPYDIGLRLGAVWDQQTVSLELGGNLSHFEARALIVDIMLPGVANEPIKQAFGWSRGNGFPILLGQVNFFMTFNVCFYRSQAYFEVSSK